ncbi:Uncharacterised protein [Vibrio cholerae]|nr:Uncharacterised protein [Vibrio cholerae]CSD55528.1 Uncharacterised protein [Vibrio cholerae]
MGPAPLVLPRSLSEIDRSIGCHLRHFAAREEPHDRHQTLSFLLGRNGQTTQPAVSLQPRAAARVINLQKVAVKAKRG